MWHKTVNGKEVLSRQRDTTLLESSAITMPGYILLYRDIERHWVWKDGLMGHRWLDLVIQAEYRSRTVFMSGVRVDLKRGQLATTTRILMARWSTNARMVLKVLNIFEQDKMIRCKKTNEMTLITICNFDKYQALFREVDVPENLDEISTEIAESGKRQRKRERKHTKEDNKETTKKIKTTTPVVESAPTHEEVFEEFFKEQSAVEVFCMQERIDLETCKKLAREVINDWVLRSETHPTMKDGRDHLLNQLRIKIKVYRQQQKRDQNVLEKTKTGTTPKVKGGLSGGVGREAEPNPLAGAKHYTADLSAGDRLQGGEEKAH